MSGDCKDASPGIYFADESSRPQLPEQKNYEVAEQLAKEVFSRADSKKVAERCGAKVVRSAAQGSVLEVEFFGSPLTVHHPSGEILTPTGDPASVFERILILHYLGGDAPVPAPAGWITFGGIPSGGFYFEAFKRRAQYPLARFFGARPALLLEAGSQLGGQPEAMGDAAVLLRPLPRVLVVAVVNGADEEFPADARLLFDGSVVAIFCTEDIAVLGGLVAGRLIRAAKALQAGSRAAPGPVGG